MIKCELAICLQFSTSMKGTSSSRHSHSLLLILISLSFLNSCGIGGPLDFIRRGEGHSRQHETTDPALLSYVQAFENEAQKQLQQSDFKVGDIPVNFGDPEHPEYVGVCFTYSDDRREVILRKEWWETADEKARQALIFHELGHCRLDRGHHDETISTESRDIRVSMMHSRMVYLNDYREMEEEYHKELYTQRSKEILSRIQSNQNGQHGQKP